MPKNRLVTGTIDAGRRVTFNEVALKGDLPSKLILLAIDPAQNGIHLWITPYGGVEGLAKKQI